MKLEKRLHAFLSCLKRKVCYGACHGYFRYTRIFSKIYRNVKKGRQLVSLAAVSYLGMNSVSSADLSKFYLNIYIALQLDQSPTLTLKIDAIPSVHFREYPCMIHERDMNNNNCIKEQSALSIFVSACNAFFKKPYRNPIYKCTRLR